MRRLIYVDGEPLLKQERRSRQIVLDQKRLTDYLEGVCDEDDRRTI